VPIVVISDDGDRAARLGVMRCGADDYFVTPCDTTELSVKLGNILRLQRFRRSTAKRNMFHAVCEQIEHGVIVVDRTLHVTYANFSAQFDFGVSEDPALTWMDQLAVRFSFCSGEEWLKALHDPASCNALMMFERGDGVGSPRWFKCMVYGMPDDPEGRVVVGLVDVSAQMQLQDVLLGVKRLVAHKMLTPLNGIVAPLDLLAEKDVSEADRDLLVDTARQSVERLSEALSSLEEYFTAHARTGVGADVSELAGVVEECRSEELIASLDFTCRERGLTLPLGRRELCTVFSELMENAVKFHPTHRPALAVNVFARTGGLRIDVADDGCHLGAVDLQRLSMPFYQGGAGISGEVDGLGLGLAQVSRIVMGVGGRIRFSNRADAPGLCVSIFLPTTVRSDSKNRAIADILAQSKFPA
jgi:nitrogen fixation/metabolism regulation signal transduction histidine kinase